jgi:hypothetical protein
VIVANKILDATSGSAEFKVSDQILTYKLLIVGTPNSNIKVFINDQENGFGGFFIKAKCLDWNGAYVKLQAKTDHVDDDFSDTGDIFEEDTLEQFKYA